MCLYTLLFRQPSPFTDDRGSTAAQREAVIEIGTRRELGLHLARHTDNLLTEEQLVRCVQDPAPLCGRVWGRPAVITLLDRLIGSGAMTGLRFSQIVCAQLPFVDLLQQMLTSDPTERITLAGIMEHAWMRPSRE